MKPYVGQIVLYTFADVDVETWGTPVGQSKTVPAIVVNVFDENTVNLTIFPDGAYSTMTKTSVPRETADHLPSDGFFWNFVPDQ